MTNTILIGSDPELFWKNEQGFVSVIGKLGGTKDCCKAIDNEGNGVLEDNVAAEFNTKPADSAEAFVLAVQKNLEFLRAEAAKFGCTLAERISAVSFPEEQMTTPEAWVFGCDPDYDAWTGDINPKPHTEDPFLRSCGGHVHLGHGKAIHARRAIQSCDLFLGVPATVLDDGRLRRSLYGKRGAFRYKPYGSEYRTLSNFWIWSGDTIRWVYERAQQAVHFAGSSHDFTSEEEALITGAINDSNMEYVKELFHRFPSIAV